MPAHHTALHPTPHTPADATHAQRLPTADGIITCSALQIPPCRTIQTAYPCRALRPLRACPTDTSSASACPGTPLDNPLCLTQPHASVNQAMLTHANNKLSATASLSVSFPTAGRLDLRLRCCPHPACILGGGLPVQRVLRSSCSCAPLHYLWTRILACCRYLLVAQCAHNTVRLPEQPHHCSAALSSH